MFNTCEYIISATSKGQNPNKDNLSEYVFLGRSNVGKSSLINSITNRKMLAYSSSKPGKTIAINFYLIDKSFYLVDVPGYGYAIKSEEMKRKFGKYIEEYLDNNKNLKVAFLLVDFVVGPTEDDVLMYNYLKYYGINTMIVATKADKIGKTFWNRKVKEICEKIRISNEQLIIASSTSKVGLDKIRELIK